MIEVLNEVKSDEARGLVDAKEMNDEAFKQLKTRFEEVACSVDAASVKYLSGASSGHIKQYTTTIDGLCYTLVYRVNLDNPKRSSYEISIEPVAAREP